MRRVSAVPIEIRRRVFQLAIVAGLASTILLSGCHSRYVQVTIVNQGTTAIEDLEVDYPSATFGDNILAAGGVFHYHFKIQGSGEMKLQYSDAQGKTHKETGPKVSEGQEGSLTITIDPSAKTTWLPDLHSK